MWPSWWFYAVVILAVAALIMSAVALGLDRKGKRGSKGCMGRTGPAGPAGVAGPAGAAGDTGATGSFIGLLNVVQVNTGNGNPFALTNAQSGSWIVIDPSGGGSGVTIQLPTNAVVGEFFYFTILPTSTFTDIGFDSGAGNLINFSGFTVPNATAVTSSNQQFFADSNANVDQTFGLALLQTTPQLIWRCFISGPSSLS
jgi:hypothetical protein